MDFKFTQGTKYVLFIFVMLFLTKSVYANSQAIPSEIQINIDRGLIAAEAGNWNEALEAFDRAAYQLDRAKVSTPPEVLFNIALANDKAPGRRLEAAANYRAYLSAAPDAENAGQIRDRANELIQEYDKIVWARIWEIEKIIPILVPKVLDKDLGHNLYIRWAIAFITGARIFMGDLTGYRKVEELLPKYELIPKYELTRDSKPEWNRVLLTLATVGEVVRAKQLLERAKENDREQILSGIESSDKDYQDRLIKLKKCEEPVIKAQTRVNWFRLGHKKEKAVDSEEFLEAFKKEMDASKHPKQIAKVLDKYSRQIYWHTYRRNHYRLIDKYCK